MQNHTPLKVEIKIDASVDIIVKDGRCLNLRSIDLMSLFHAAKYRDGYYFLSFKQFEALSSLKEE